MENIVPVDFRGTVQCDGYRAYDCFSKKRSGNVSLAGCWTHERRKFVEACANAPKGAALVLRLMQNLYRKEARLRERRSSPKLRAITR